MGVGGIWKESSAPWEARWDFWREWAEWSSSLPSGDTLGSLAFFFFLTSARGGVTTAAARDFLIGLRGGLGDELEVTATGDTLTAFLPRDPYLTATLAFVDALIGGGGVGDFERRSSSFSWPLPLPFGR